MWSSDDPSPITVDSLCSPFDLSYLRVMRAENAAGRWLLFRFAGPKDGSCFDWWCGPQAARQLLTAARKCLAAYELPDREFVRQRITARVECGETGRAIELRWFYSRKNDELRSYLRLFGPRGGDLGSFSLAFEREVHDLVSATERAIEELYGPDRESEALEQLLER